MKGSWSRTSIMGGMVFSLITGLCGIAIVTIQGIDTGLAREADRKLLASVSGFPAPELVSGVLTQDGRAVFRLGTGPAANLATVLQAGKLSKAGLFAIVFSPNGAISTVSLAYSNETKSPETTKSPKESGVPGMSLEGLDRSIRQALQRQTSMIKAALAKGAAK